MVGRMRCTEREDGLRWSIGRIAIEAENGVSWMVGDGSWAALPGSAALPWDGASLFRSQTLLAPNASQPSQKAPGARAPSG